MAIDRVELVDSDTAYTQSTKSEQELQILAITACINNAANTGNTTAVFQERITDPDVIETFTDQGYEFTYLPHVQPGGPICIKIPESEG